MATGFKGDTAAERSAAEREVVDICRDLIRIDSTNYGDGSGPGEREAAEYVAAKLAEVGYEPDVFESAERRTNVVVRLPGADRSRPALVVHGHTDVVPAQAADWQVPPFAGEIRDGCLWGRGAVDMKNMVAMIIAVARDLKRTGRSPERDLIFAFFADEEHGGEFGAGWTVKNRPELFDGATEAISEVGGFSVELEGRRAYLIQTAEKGIAWLRLLATGKAGHGSVINRDNAVTHLAAAVTRIAQYQWPRRTIPAVAGLLQGVAELTGLPYDDDDPTTIDALVAALGPAANFVGATLATNANPTMLSAGYKANVVPGAAEAVVDVRFLPGEEQTTLAKIDELLGPNVRREFVANNIALEAPFETPLVANMTAALLAEDPGAAVLPYALSGGTDNKWLATLGITGYGFAPLQLPGDLDFAAMFHGVDERVPLASLRFGARVLERFLLTA